MSKTGTRLPNKSAPSRPPSPCRQNPPVRRTEAPPLRPTLADRAKRLELTLRISLAGDDRLRLFLEGDPSVDPEYRALVEGYYRSLSREGSSR